MHRLFFAAVAAVASLAASAADWYDITDNVLTFNVTSGTQTYSDDIPGSIVRIVKNGAGTVVIPGANKGFTSGKAVEVRAGVLEMQDKYSLGSGNTVTVLEGAQLRTTFKSSDWHGADAALNDFVIAGSGPDGSGALWSQVKARADWYWGNITLTDDATLCMSDNFYNGFTKTVDLAGHTLTVSGSTGATASFNSFTLKAGTLVMNGPKTCLQGEIVCEGGATGRLSFNASSAIEFWNSLTPIPWAVDFGAQGTINLSQTKRGGVMDYDTVNVVEGPVTSTKNLYINGSASYANPPQSVRFKGAFDFSNSAGLFIENTGTPIVFFDGSDDTLRKIPTLSVSGAQLVLEKGELHASAGSSSSYTIGYNSAVAARPARLLIRRGARLTADVKPNSGNVLTAKFNVNDIGVMPSIVEVEDGAAFTNLILMATQTGGRGVFIQHGGDVYNLSIGGGNDGHMAQTGNGYYGLYGGTYANRYYTSVANKGGANGLFYQTAGTATCVGLNGGPALCVSRGGNGEYLMRGGSFKTTYNLMLGEVQWSSSKGPTGGTGVFTMCDGDPQAHVDGWVDLNQRTNDFMTALNLNAGTLRTKTICVSAGTAGRENARSYVNFNGGRLIPTSNNTGFFNADQTSYLTTAPTAITIFEKGGTISTEGTTNYFSRAGNGKAAGDVMVFRGATGRGVKSITLPAEMPKTGYVGILPVLISGGGGAGATAALDFDPVTSNVAEKALITCPGWDYAEPPTVTVYGPDMKTTYTCTAELTEEDQVPGPLVKTGSGMLIVNSANNTYAGTYVVSNGILKVPSAYPIPAATTLVLAGGGFWYDWQDRTIKSLGGYGEFYGYIGDNTTHTLTVTGSLDFDAADVMEGRMLVMKSDIGVNGTTVQTVDKDKLVLGNDCKVRISNADRLPTDKASYTLLKVNVPLNRLPELENQAALGDGAWKVRLAKGGKELKLVHDIGTFIYIR